MQHRTEGETRELVARRLEELGKELPEDVREKVKKKLDEWISDDSIRGLSSLSEEEAIQEIDDFFKEALEAVQEEMS